MKIRKDERSTMQVVAERLGCEPDALEIVEAIERLKARVKRLNERLRSSR